MSKTPKVSVVMPAYNAEKYVSEAIESILNQTFKDFEFIIVNDCSTDSTKKIIEKYAREDKRIKLINNEKNLKVTATANKGASEAKGEYIVRLDSDDWSYPDRLEKQVKYMDAHPEIVLSSGNMEMCDENMNMKNRSHVPTNSTTIMNVLLQYNPTVHSAMIYKRSTFLEVGGYGGINNAEDYLLVMKMASKGQLGNLEDVLIKYRVLSTSLTAKNSTDMHLATLYCQLEGHLHYGYPMTFKTKMMTIARLCIAYFMPSSFWRFVSTKLRK